jgi:hypothetical protein
VARTEHDLIEYYDDKSYPSHKGAIAGLLIVFGAFIAAGVYSLVNLWAEYATEITAIIEAIAGAGVTGYAGIAAVAIIGGLVFLSLIVAFGASALARRLGGTLIYIGAGFMLAMTLGFGLLGWAFIGFDPGAWFILIPGLFTLLITILLFTVFKDRIRRAGEIIKLTGRFCLEEKGVFVPPLLTMIFTLVSALMFGAIIFQFTPFEVLLGDQPLTLENGWPMALGMVAYLFVTIFFYNMSYGTASGMVYIYMRGRDPSLGDGWRAALNVVTGIIALSIASVIVTIIRMIIRAVARKSGTGGQIVGGIVESIMGWIWMLVNYFTIPAMVAEELGAKDGIKRSAGLVKRNFMDVMIRETAVRWGFGVLAAIMFIGFGLGGAMIGWAIGALGIVAYDPLILALVVGILFVIFAAIPSTLVLRTFDIVYVTLLYVFIRRKEGTITGKTAIPAGMNKELDGAYSRARTSGADF